MKFVCKCLKNEIPLKFFFLCFCYSSETRYAIPFRFVDPFEGKAEQAANVLAVHFGYFV